MIIVKTRAIKNPAAIVKAIFQASPVAGFSVSSGGGVVITVASGPNAPTLTWTSPSSDTTPEFNIDFDDSVVATDVVTVEYDDDPAFGSSSIATDVLDAGEITASSIDLALADLAAGTYYVRAKITHGAQVSSWSNVVTITISASDDDDYSAWLAAA